MAFYYEVKEKISVLSVDEEKSRTKEVRLVAYSGMLRPKLDIRFWTHENNSETLGKGFTLNKTEAIKLRDALNAMNLENREDIYDGKVRES